MRRATGVMGAAVLAWAVCGAYGQTGVSDDDRVVFYGDSLVNPPGFGAMVENFVRVKYPQSKAHFWHVGVNARGLAKAADAGAQFDELVAPLRPTVIVLCVGLGDGDLKSYDARRVSKTAEEFGQLVDRCISVGAKVFAVTPPLPTISKKQILAQRGFDETVGKIGEAFAEVGRPKGITIIDWFGALSKLAEQGRGAELTGPDALNPTPLSKSVAADLILEAWKLEPIEVAIDVDWAAQSATSTAGKVEMSKLDEATSRLTLRGFPMPFHTGTGPSALREEFPCARFSRVILKIANVPEGSVLLSGSGSKQAPVTVSAERVREGINLSLAGPLATAEAATKLGHLIASKNQAYDTLVQVRRELEAEPPEPEYVQAYKSHLLSREQYYEGSIKIIERTPRTLDTAIDITIEGSGG